MGSTDDLERRIRAVEVDVATLQSESKHTSDLLAEVRAGQLALVKTVWRAVGVMSTLFGVAALLAKLL